MYNPSLPKISIGPHYTLLDGAPAEQTRLMRSNLKRTLSKDIVTSQDETAMPEENNQFLFEENNGKRFVSKPIINNNAMESPLIADAPKQIKFSLTHVHVVENWKEYNKPERCCHCCIFQ